MKVDWHADIKSDKQTNDEKRAKKKWRPCDSQLYNSKDNPHTKLEKIRRRKKVLG